MADETGVADVAPKVEGGTLGFPNPSGKSWAREEAGDKAPGGRGSRGGSSPRPSLTKAARKKKVEDRLGKLYVGFAGFTAALGAEYPSTVLLANTSDFVDAVMEIAEDDPRILDWLDSKAAISGYWKLALVSVSISLPIAAYYGAAPEFVIPLLGAPPIPYEADDENDDENEAEKPPRLSEVH